MNRQFTFPNRKKLTILLILALPFLAVAFLMVAAGSGQVTSAPTQAQIHHVSVQPIKLLKAHQQTKLAYGLVEASNQSHLGFELAGKVIEILVDEGESIEPGMALAKLDTSRLEASMQEIEATLARTLADLRLAQLSLKRIKELVSKNLESKQKLDEMAESTASAAALVDEIYAKRASLKLELEKSILRAAHKATVLARPIDIGTVISAGQTVFTVQHTNAYEVRIGMPQDQAFSLQVGQTYPLIYGETNVQGQVKSIAKHRQLHTRTVDLMFKLQIPNGLTLLPGDLLAFEYKQVMPEAGIWVESDALSSGIRGLWTLFVVPATGQQVVSSKSVNILYSEQNKVFISGNFSPQEWAIVNGGHRLVPGQKVEAIAAKTSSLISGN